MLTLTDSLGWWTRRFQRTPAPVPAPAPAAPDTVRRTPRAAERDPDRAARQARTVSLEDRVLAERVADALGDVESRLAAFTDGPRRAGLDT